MILTAVPSCWPERWSTILSTPGSSSVMVGVVRLADEYLNAHRPPGGGVRMVWAGGATYDAMPANVRDARRDVDRDRNNASAAVAQAAKYRREVKTPEQREGKHKVSRLAAEELLESLRSFGYLDAFPVTINATGQVIEGNHRLQFAELARRSLVEEREQVAANGSDPLLLADLDRRIASLERDRIMGGAVRPDGRAADDVKVIVASQIQIPWLAHERRQLARRLSLDGYEVPAIARMLDASERSIKRWTQEDRESTQAEREAAQNAEIERLSDLGWSTPRIARRLGIGQSTVDRRLKEATRDGQVARAGNGDIGRPRRGGRVSRIDDAELARAADEFLAEGGTSSHGLKVRLREQGRGTVAVRVEAAWREAKARAAERQVRERMTGQPVPAPEPPAPEQPELRVCDKCGGTGHLLVGGPA